MRILEQEDKVLFKTNWIQVKETERKFQYLERKGKDSVAIFLLRRFLKNQIFQYEVLVRYQPLPITNNDDSLYPCPITGGLELNESILNCALREVKEESGYSLTDLKYLGSYIVGTQTNEKVYMYYFDVTAVIPEIPLLDDTYHESISKNVWENLHNLKGYDYSACQIGYYILKGKLGI